jgi:hypothetical protein
MKRFAFAAAISIGIAGIITAARRRMSRTETTEDRNLYEVRAIGI